MYWPAVVKVFHFNHGKYFPPEKPVKLSIFGNTSLSLLLLLLLSSLSLLSLSLESGSHVFQDGLGFATQPRMTFNP